MECKTELIPRILRDIDDGVLALDKTGHIIYINHQCQELLDLSGEEVGKTYAEVFYDDHKVVNAESGITRNYTRKNDAVGVSLDITF